MWNNFNVVSRNPYAGSEWIAVLLKNKTDGRTEWVWHNKDLSSTYHSCCSVPRWKEAREVGGRWLVTQLPVLCFYRASPKRPSSLKRSCSGWHPGSWHPTLSSLKRFWSAGITNTNTLPSQPFAKILSNMSAKPSQHTWQLEVPQRHWERGGEERLQDENLQGVLEPRRSLDAGKEAEMQSELLEIISSLRNAD